MQTLKLKIIINSLPTDQSFTIISTARKRKKLSCLRLYFLSEVHLEEEEEYKNDLRITPECFDKLFGVVKDNITK